LNNNSNPKVLDLFAGVGGLSLGFEMAGFQIAAAVEYDEEIAEAYRKNHEGVKMIIGDITKIDLHDVFESYRGKIDVVVGGPPCQGFSQKGMRKSLKDKRNFLFMSYCKIVEIVQPQYFVMENVPNLLTTECGYFKREIEEIFEAMGYSLDLDILIASNFGVPQDRCRAVIIGKKADIGIGLPLPTGKKVTVWDAISDLAYFSSGEGESEQPYRNPPQTQYQKLLREDSKTLYNHQATSHSKLTLERLALIPDNCTEKVLPPEHLTKSVYSGTWTRISKDKTSVTITTRFDTPSSGQFTHPFLNRAITVREAARLQSFPDTFIFYGTKGSQMKQVGNAVPPLMAKEIALVIVRDIEKKVKDYGVA